MRTRTCLLIACLLAAGATTLGVAQRAVNLDDMARMRTVGDPQCSPDGRFVAYTVGTIDAKADKHHSHVWMASYDGS
ncbi:MAG TPA: hypothetical protein VN709_12640, partial [Terriglobales bacterium]|nr:hypothetical protein [Terriglobales bacterium]